MTLSDDDWREIQALKLILPDGARQEINHWIDLEVRLRHSRQRPAVTRGKLLRLHAFAAKLSSEMATIDDVVMGALLDVRSTAPTAAGSDERLAALGPLISRTSADITEIDGETAAALATLKSVQRSTTPQPSRLNAVRSLDGCLAQLNVLTRWLQTAAKNIKAGKRGPDGESHEWLARRCAEFLQHHKAGRLSRSYKAKAEAEFTKIVLRAAARTAGGQLLKSGTGAIRRVAKARGRIGAKNLG